MPSVIGVATQLNLCLLKFLYTNYTPVKCMPEKEAYNGLYFFLCNEINKNSGLSGLKSFFLRNIKYTANFK